MRTVVLVITGIFAVILQGSVFSLFSLYGAQVDILLLIILSLAVAEQTQVPVIFAIVFGALLDMLYSPQVGFYAVAYTAVAGVAVYTLKRVGRINVLTVVSAGLLGSLIAQCMCMLLAYALGARFSAIDMFKSHMLPQAALSAALMMPAYFLTSRLLRPGEPFGRRKKLMRE